MGKRSHINPEIYRDDLCQYYALTRKVSKKEAEEAVDTVFELIVELLVAGNDVKLNKFFNFFGRTRKAKSGQNPVTKEDIVIPETRTVVVKMTKPTKDRIQGKR